MDLLNVVISSLIFLGIALLVAVYGSKNGEPLVGKQEEERPDEEVGDQPVYLPRAVAILVIDDFQTTVSEGGEEREFAGGNLCSVTPDGQIYRAEGLIYRAEGLGWLKIPGVSHGELVYSQLEKLLLERHGNPVSSQTGSALFALDWIDKIQVWDIDGQHLLLVAVDTRQYDSGVIAGRLQAAMEALKNSEWEVGSYVWNMSFGFVPCDLEISEEEYQQLLASEGELQALRESLYAAINKDLTEEDVEQYLTEEDVEQYLTEEDVEQYLRGYARLRIAYQGYVPEEEAFPAWLHEDPVSALAIRLPETMTYVEALIPIASAGNSGLSYPFAPATWNGFISVSSQISNTPQKAAYANDGEVMMPDTYKFNGDTVIGTSFAAPQLSVRAASHLLAGGMVSCSGQVDTATPPFNYATMSGPWNNLSLSDAINQYCHDFPP